MSLLVLGHENCPRSWKCAGKRPVTLSRHYLWYFSLLCDLGATIIHVTKKKAFVCSSSVSFLIVTLFFVQMFYSCHWMERRCPSSCSLPIPLILHHSFSSLWCFSFCGMITRLILEVKVDIYHFFISFNSFIVIFLFSSITTFILVTKWKNEKSLYLVGFIIIICLWLADHFHYLVIQWERHVQL